MLTEVKKYKDLKTLPDSEKRVGNVVIVKNENKCYVYSEDDRWMPMTYKGSGLKMNLYELNKTMIPQMGTMDEEALDQMKRDIDEKLTSEYYLLYGKEISYFTLFQKKEKSEETLGEVVVDCLKRFENIYCYEFKDEDKTIEIWVQNGTEEGSATVLYLFDYTDGVVYYE